MESVDNCNSSIFNLATKLAKSFSRDKQGYVLETDVVRRRTQIFEIILNKDTEVTADINELLKSELKLQISDCKQGMLLKNNQSWIARYEALQKFQNIIVQQDSVLSSPLGESIAYILLCTSKLNLSIKDHEKVEIKKAKHKVRRPLPFRLEPLPNAEEDSEQEAGDKDDKCLLDKILRPVPKLFKPVEYMNNKLDSSLPSASQHFGLENNLPNLACNANENKPLCFRDSFARLEEPKYLQLKSDTPMRLPKLPLHETSCNENIATRRQQIPSPGKLFVSDLKSLNGLFQESPIQTVSKIQLQEFIEHLKNAAVGLMSETFFCNADGIFVIKEQTTVDGVSPDVLKDFVYPFLNCGTCYLRLSTLTKWDRFVSNQSIEQPLNRVMRMALSEFLAIFRQLLLAQKIQQLSKLFKETRPTMNLVVELDSMFFDEPRLNLAKGTNGAFLLNYIWSRTDVYINNNHSVLLKYFLKILCQIYYSQLQRWIYHGLLHESLNEIFITPCIEKYDIHSKEFYDKAYTISYDALPGFLCGCEHIILQCGRYNQLLRAFKTQHILFQLKYPEIVVCMDEEQLNLAYKNLKQYYMNMDEQFKKPYMIKDVYAERALQKNKIKNCTAERVQKYIAQREEEKREEQLKKRAKQQQLYADFLLEKEEQLQRKLEQRRLRIVEEISYQKSEQKLEDQRLQQEKVALLKQNELYQKTLSDENKQKDDPGLRASPDQNSSSSECLSFVSCEENACVEKEEVIKVEEEKTLTTDSVQALEVELKRSNSDVLNSNSTQHDQTSADALRNRIHVMSSKQFTESQGQNNNGSTLSFVKDTKLRAELPHDENLNTMSHNEDISALQRNRQRMMTHDAFDAFNSHSNWDTHHSQLLLNAQTERGRNKIRVLGSEYDIIVGDKSMLHLPLDHDKVHVHEIIDTPMSTTSDVDEPMTNMVEEKCLDTANNNLNSIRETVGNDENEDHENPVFQPSEQALSCNAEIQSNAVETSMLDSIGGTKCYQPHNPFMLKRYLQQSVMLPLNAHFSLLCNEMMRIFLKDLRLYEHLRHLRNYFFLLDGEFGTVLTGSILRHINDGMEPNSLCQKDFLDAILDNALSASSADCTDAAQNLILNCTRINEKFDLISLDTLGTFTLQYKIDWPLNLVISNETLAKYAQVFSHLLKIHHVTFVLERAFEYLQAMSKLHGSRLCSSPQYRHLLIVRHKLSHFVSSLRNHFSVNAILASWKKFKDELISAKTIENLYQLHVAYLKRVSFLMFLNRQSAIFKEAIDNIFVTVLRFCKILCSQVFTLEAKQFVHPRYSRLIHEESEFEKFMHYIIYLGNKVASSGYQEEIGDLMLIINFNNYYNVPS